MFTAPILTCRRLCIAAAAFAFYPALGAPSVGAENRDMRDLGYGNGLTLEGQGARQTLFFPVPAGAEGARITLDAHFSSALDNYSGLTLRANGEPLATVLKRDDIRQRLAVDVPLRLLDGDYLPVEIAGDLAIERDACADNALPSVWARLGPDSGVTFSGGGRGETLGDLWRTLSDRARVALLPTPSPTELSAALTVMAGLHRRGIEPVPVVMPADLPADLPDIVIGDPPWPHGQASTVASDDALSILRTDGPAGPRRALWVRDPAAAHLLAARAELLRGQTRIETVSHNILPELQATGPGGEARNTRRLTFADLGYPTRETTFSSRGAFRIDLPMARVPSGYVPNAFALSLRGPELGESDAVLFNAYANDTYAESLRLDGEVLLERKRIPISPSLLGGTNTIQIALQRLAPYRPCARGLTTTVQLHGSSHFELVHGDFTPARLIDWTARYDETVEIVLPDGMNARMRALPLVARLIAEGTIPGTDLRVVDQPRRDGPFIHVAATPSKAYDTAPVVTDQGRVRIDTSGGRVLHFDPGSDMTLVELVERGGAWGVWIAPGARMDLPSDRGLGNGDAILIPPTGAPVVLNTRADTFSVAYPERRDPLALLKRYGDAFFWSFWVLLSLVVAVVVIRMRRNERGTS